MPRVQTRLDSCTGFVNAISPHLVWRSSRATPCARYLAPQTSHPPRVTFSPRRKIGVGGGYPFDFSGSGDTPSVARRSTLAAKDALALESWVGFRHCHVSYARGMRLLPLRPWVLTRSVRLVVFRASTAGGRAREQRAPQGRTGAVR